MDRLSDEHLRAKRARVENIIRGMSHSPLVRPNTGDHNQESNRGGSNEHRGDGRTDCPSSLLSSPGSRGGVVSAGEVYRENKRKQRLPQQQQSFTQLVCSRQEQRQEERRQLKLQLEDMQVGEIFLLRCLLTETSSLIFSVPLSFRSNCANSRRSSTRSTTPRRKRRRRTARAGEEEERRTATCRRTASARTAWRSGTGSGRGAATTTCRSWTRACSWTGPEPCSESRP